MRNHNGSPSEIYSDDSLANSGRQVITLSNGARAEVLLINTGARRVTSRWSTRRGETLLLSVLTGVISSSELLESGPSSALRRPASAVVTRAPLADFLTLY
jgi:hypothetical protein